MLKGKSILGNLERSPGRFSLCLNSTDIYIDDDFVDENSLRLQVQVYPCTKNCRPDLLELLDSGKLKLVLGFSESSLVLDSPTFPFQFQYNTKRRFPILQTKTVSRKFYLSKTTVATNKGRNHCVDST